MSWKQTAFVVAAVTTWSGLTSAQDGDTQAPLLLPPASGANASAGTQEAAPAQTSDAAGPDLIPPAPSQTQPRPATSPEPVPAQAVPGTGDEVPNVGLRPGERLVPAAPAVRPAEQVIRQRRPAGTDSPPRATNFRPVTPSAPASEAEYQIDEAVRQATRNLAIDDETRSRYRLNGDEWWFLARSGKWMYFRDGAWQEFDPQTYRPPGAATAAGTALAGGSAVVPLGGEAAGPVPAGSFYGPGPFQGGPFPIPGFQPYPGYLVPADMDPGDLRRAERRARRGGGLFGWLRD